MAKPCVPNLQDAQDDIYSKWGNFDSTVAIICGSGLGWSDSSLSNLQRY